MHKLLPFVISHYECKKQNKQQANKKALHYLNWNRNPSENEVFWVQFLIVIAYLQVQPLFKIKSKVFICLIDETNNPFQNRQFFKISHHLAFGRVAYIYQRDTAGLH